MNLLKAKSELREGKGRFCYEIHKNQMLPM
jgi:hypothetical protein